MSFTETVHIDPEGCVDRVKSIPNHACLIRGAGYIHHDRVAVEAFDTGNGIIVRWRALSCVKQDYYVCLDYSQARDIVLALSAFKPALGFAPKDAG
jgi:hypothetical protein